MFTNHQQVVTACWWHLQTVCPPSTQVMTVNSAYCIAEKHIYQHPVIATIWMVYPSFDTRTLNTHQNSHNQEIKNELHWLCDQWNHCATQSSPMLRSPVASRDASSQNTFLAYPTSTLDHYYWYMSPWLCQCTGDEISSPTKNEVPSVTQGPLQKSDLKIDLYSGVDTKLMTPIIDW